MMKHFDGIESVDFICPHGIDWGAGIQEPEAPIIKREEDMPQFRKVSNGFLVAPHRGVPPEPPEGYERYLGQNFVFAPKVEPCDFRDRVMKKSGCCGSKETITCKRDNKIITLNICKECKDA